MSRVRVNVNFSEFIKEDGIPPEILQEGIKLRLNWTSPSKISDLAKIASINIKIKNLEDNGGDVKKIFKLINER